MTDNGFTVRGSSISFGPAFVSRYSDNRRRTESGRIRRSDIAVHGRTGVVRGAARRTFTGRAVGYRAVKRAVNAIAVNLNNIYMSVAGAALGLSIFFIFSVIAANERGGTAGLGGEVIAAVVVMCVFNCVWRRIRGKFKD